MASSIATPAQPTAPSKSSHPPTGTIIPHILHPPTPPHSSPSSPSSTHSSSSAIFERDIEPLSLSTLPAPRDHTLAAFVPSVLDEAIEALTAAGEGGEGMADVEVELAGPGAAQAEEDGGVFRRSPSPPGIPAASSLAAAAAARPAVLSRESTTPFIPGGFSTSSTQAVATPTGLTTPPSPGSPKADHPLPSLTVPAPTTGVSSPSSATSSGVTARTPSSHASPAKRLSFISYSDLLLSSPITSLPLSQVTSPAAPPPHLAALAQGAAAHAGAAGSAASRDQSAYGDEGGEWERVGLGKGLEERLEEVLKARPPEVGKA